MALNSWQFVLLAIAATALLPVTRGWFRTGIFLALNLAFIWTYWGVAAMPLGMAFVLLGYAAASVVRGRGTAALIGSLSVLTLVFVLLRGYGFDGGAASRSIGLNVVAIAGVSFLFFKMVHVVVDVSSGTIPHIPFAGYLNYCLNFTTVLMGPIQRFQDFVAQWNGPDSTSPLGFEQAIDATNRVLRGFLKAFVLAPYLAPYVLKPGLPIDSLSAGEAFLRIYSFYIFLYLDFSGYCDIVIGIGGLMGIRPPENFDFPFLARNVSAYWLRVHRSLTQWLTDYIFTPSYTFALRARGLAGHGFLALAACLLLTMLIAGVWHGTTANFAVFGLIHGVALVIVRGYEQAMTRWLGRARFHRLRDSRLATVAAVFLTYNFTSLAYVFFVLNVPDSLQLLGRLTTLATGLVA